MVIRRFNYTGRKRIRHTDAKVSLYEVGNGATAFDISLDLSSYDLPKGARVCVEAYRQTNWMRFPYGSAESIEPPEVRDLVEFESPDSVLFRVRVTEAKSPEGLLLAEADKIRPRLPGEEESDSVPLLPVRSASGLGDQVYLIDYEGGPRLLINDKMGDWRSLARDPAFSALVYPAVLKEVLLRVTHIEECYDPDDHDDWRSQWLQFAVSLPGAQPVPADTQAQQIDDWVDEVVAAFYRRRSYLSVFKGSWIVEGVS